MKKDIRLIPKSSNTDYMQGIIVGMNVKSRMDAHIVQCLGNKERIIGEKDF